jgi:hypothetical protein
MYANPSAIMDWSMGLNNVMTMEEEDVSLIAQEQNRVSIAL